MRVGRLERNTTETSVTLELTLEGEGKFKGGTGIPFFDHMLQLWCHHGSCDLLVDALGDLEVDCHHTVEDVGICLGKSINKALGTKEGINRYGTAWVPMDETLAMVALDISGRPYLFYDVPVETDRIGSFEVEVVEEFFRAVCNNAAITLHIQLIRGKNAHHIIEAVFKAFGHAFREAVALTGSGIPSTKGML